MGRLPEIHCDSVIILSLCNILFSVQWVVFKAYKFSAGLFIIVTSEDVSYSYTILRNFKFLERNKNMITNSIKYWQKLLDTLIIINIKYKILRDLKTYLDHIKQLWWSFFLFCFLFFNFFFFFFFGKNTKPLTNFWKYHCVKTVQIRSFSGRYFPAFGLNTERYFASLRIQFKWHISRSDPIIFVWKDPKYTSDIDNNKVFCKKGFFRNFAKFTVKHLCQGLFFNKFAGPPLLKKGIWHRCFLWILQNF